MITNDNFRFSIKATTGDDGKIDIVIPVPGTFNGIDPSVSNGRLFISALLWTNNPVDEDRITQISLQDKDGVLPVPARAQFANYPILGYSIDPEMTYGNVILAEILLNGSRVTEMGPPLVPRFLPSGFYLCATFTAGDAAANRILYGNFLWIKRTITA